MLVAPTTKVLIQGIPWRLPLDRRHRGVQPHGKWIAPRRQHERIRGSSYRRGKPKAISWSSVAGKLKPKRYINQKKPI
jgi:hypothetical protein